MTARSSLLRENHDYTLNPAFPLTDNQNRAVEFLLTSRVAILALQTGYGKTYTSLTAAKLVLDRFSSAFVIIACPLGAVKIFEKELRSKLNLSYSVLTADRRELSPGSRVLIISHSVLYRAQALIQKICQKRVCVLIFDEAHVLQSGSSRLFKTVATLRPHFGVVWALTATPLLNHLEGLYYLVNLVSPNYFGSWPSFKRRFLVLRKRTIMRGGKSVTIDEVVGYKNLDRLAVSLKGLIFVLGRQYSLHFNYVTAELSSEEDVYYKRASRGIIWDEQRDFAHRLHDLQQVVDNAHVAMQGRGLSSKEKAFLRLVRDVIRRRESVLVYVDYYASCDRLLYLLKAFGVKRLFQLTGRVDPSVRSGVEDEIQPGTVIVMTRAASSSMNLQKCNNVIFYDIPFALGTFIQTVGRIARMDSPYSDLNVYLLEVRGTIDTYKRVLIQDHSALVQSIFGANPNLPLEVGFIDRRFIQQLRDVLLWKRPARSR